MTRTALFLMGCVFFAAPALALEVKCPERIVTTQALAELAAGWNSFVRPGQENQKGRWSLPTRIDLYDGDPKEIVQLKPESESESEMDVWTFSTPIPASRPIYMVCVYSDTYVSVSKALPTNIQRCQSTGEGVLKCEVKKP